MSRLKTLFNVDTADKMCRSIAEELGPSEISKVMCKIHPVDCRHCPLNYSRLERELTRRGVMQPVAYQNLKRGS